MAGPPIPFEIHPSSGVPIYRQLIDQVLALVAGGKMREGDLLPSVRQVAQAAAINPMTVSKAYSRLEADGVVKRVRGRGMRVAPIGGRGQTTGTISERQQQFRELAELALHRAGQLGLSPQEIQAVLDDLLNNLATDHSTRDETNVTPQARQN